MGEQAGMPLTLLHGAFASCAYWVLNKKEATKIRVYVAQKTQ